ncbi:MAG: hypothetical protein COT74_09305 [Bdellovibrionales bacterium CG10_big_fil_rev_8_21_14_0_10_45_34]|nr:MAG: hypothetical protein COT74_09305 [Bdellovibrionales bacterium CG10_big_fil_rev_8_21_14_0_10_45_34]
MPQGSQCVSETQSRTCNNGVFTAWTGSYTQLSCTVEAPPAPTPTPTPAPTPAPVPGGFAIQPVSKITVSTELDELYPISIPLKFQNSSGAIVTAIRKLWRSGNEMPISQKLTVISANEITWTVDATYYGSYEIEVAAQDSKSTATARIPIEILRPTTLPPIHKLTSGALGILFQKLWSDGSAAGNINDWYANHDNLHGNNWWFDQFPQIRRLPEDRTGFQTTAIPGKVVWGNASLAVTSGENWASLPRYHMHFGYKIESSYKIFRQNQINYHPEHTDHDSVDHFHLNQPFVGISQGSSGSEIYAGGLDACVLATMRPEVKTALVERGLLMAVLVMARRRIRAGSDEVYLSGAGHPTAIGTDFTNQKCLDLINFTNGISAMEIPPVAQVAIKSETFSSPSEQLYTGPWLINRIFRGNEFTKKMRVSAATSFDVNGRKLTYHWKVLRSGDDKVRIQPLNSNASEVDIEIDYHPRTNNGGTTLPSNRVDIGLFVHNGSYYSMPALITSFTLDNETRIYDDQGNLVSKEQNTNYVHPLLK